MRVRRAEPRDLPTIKQIATAAWKTTLAGLLDHSLVDQWLETAYSPAALAERLDDHPVFVVIADERPVAFADAFIEEDRLVLSALCTHPEYRRQGAATLLLERIRSLVSHLPLSVDIFVGNHGAEAFAAAAGFVPGEPIEGHLYGRPLLERRWWLGVDEGASV